ncbi:hypothetical protein FOA52_010219 [Chlamydomonas sp. UWO 241]|nr:hypothetical protein FOA52_010219 [Chlamydomonas sp. UWO 241]
MALLVSREAHDAEVTALAFSPQGFLATGSRDGIIHVFETVDFSLVNTLDEHNGAVTAVRFSPCGSRLVSCGSDRRIIFRDIVDASDCTAVTRGVVALPAAAGQSRPGGTPGAGGTPVGTATRAAAGGGGLHDLALDVRGQTAVTAGADGALRVFDVEGARQINTVWQSGGHALRVCLSANGSVAIVACGDGSVAAYDVGVAGGRLLARASGGHSSPATSVSLSASSGRLVTTGGDGCVMQWRLPENLGNRIASAAAQVAHEAAASQLQQQQQRQPQTASASGAKSGDPMASGWLAALPEANPLAGDESPRAHSSGLQRARAPMGTMARLRQGQPLLSVDKLPRWATRPPLPVSFDDTECASEGGSIGGSSAGGGCDDDAASRGEQEAAPAAAAARLTRAAAKAATAIMASTQAGPGSSTKSASSGGIRAVRAWSGGGGTPAAAAAAAPAAAAAAGAAGSNVRPARGGALPSPGGGMMYDVDMSPSAAMLRGSSGALPSDVSASGGRPWADGLEDDDEIVYCRWVC